MGDTCCGKKGKLEEGREKEKEKGRKGWENTPRNL